VEVQHPFPLYHNAKVGFHIVPEVKVKEPAIHKEHAVIMETTSRSLIMLIVNNGILCVQSMGQIMDAYTRHVSITV